MSRHFFFLFICCVCLEGCTSYIDIQQPPYDQKIAVDGWIESGDYARIYLTLSSPYLTQYDSTSIRASLLNYAKVTLTSSQGDSEILTLMNDNSAFPPFVYKSINMMGEEGVSYQLTIEANGHVLTSTTTIPKAPTLMEVCIDHQTDSSGIVKASILPDCQDTLLLLLQTKSIKADKNFHPCIPQLAKIGNGFSIYAVDLYRTSETNIASSTSQQEFYYRWPELQFALQDTVLIKIGSVDKTSYKVLNSIFQDQNDRKNPFAFNGNVIETNITGGIGHWTGVANAPIKTIMP
jgi:hypothetical protein